MSETDKQYDGRLIDEYFVLLEIRDQAEKGDTAETVKMINKKMEVIRLKLSPTELPE